MNHRFRKPGWPLLRQGMLTCVIFVGLGVFAWRFMIVPAQNKATFAEKSRICMRNMEAIAQALRQYASENDGRFPVSLSVLSEQGLIGKDELKCPFAGFRPAIDDWSYDYIAGQNLNSCNSESVLIFESVRRHSGKRSGTWTGRVCFCDGAYKSLQPKEFARVVESTRASVVELSKDSNMHRGGSEDE